MYCTISKSQNGKISTKQSTPKTFNYTYSGSISKLGHLQINIQTRGGSPNPFYIALEGVVHIISFSFQTNGNLHNIIHFD